MEPHEVAALFDKMAGGYDQQWAKLSAFRDTTNVLIGALFAELAEDARVLCVGAGTGAELIYLATRFPRFRFSAVDPSAGMLDVCRQRAQEHGFADRCSFHVGFLDSLPRAEPFDAATCLLVSQFLLDQSVRTALFQTIARHLRADGILASSDLSADVSSEAYRSLLDVWARAMANTCTPPEVERMRAAYARDVGVLPPNQVQQMIAAGGFDTPVQFVQTGLIHGWYARRLAAVAT
jgi:tRNA (cmo5U34)-methyltransferase